MKRLPWLVALALLAVPSAWAGGLARPYTDPAQLTGLPFGAYSPWLQPWRAYLTTVPAATFLNGVGVVLTLNGADPDLVVRMLARHGVRRTRIEAGWGGVDFHDETRRNDARELQAALRACRRYGVRPMILLNAHQGAPCPTRYFERVVTAGAHKGDTRVTLDDTRDLRVGYSGLSNLTDYWAAEALVTRIDGNTITLSKPLPKDITAGTRVPMATLKYRPFAPPDSDDYAATVAGWQQYVGAVARFAAEALGTTGDADKGFDLEIWNELTFGDEFLYFNHYYADTPYRYPAGTDETSIWGNLVKATAAYVDAHPDQFSGVLLSDGFSNTIPWTASSQEPARVGALGKHPYFGRRHYPKDQSKGRYLNALGQAEDPPSFVPAYDAFFPEYYATALQTETLIRDAAPLTTGIYGTPHGENARVVNGTVIPCSVVFTECNVDPMGDNPAITDAQARALKAKNALRTFCFYMDKGVTLIDLYAAAPNDAKAGDKELGIVQQSFVDYARRPGAVYPADDRPYTSPALAALSHLAAKVRVGLDAGLTKTRPLSVVSITDPHDHAQFAGDGTAAHPSLYDRDVFAFLPYQVNTRRFVIPYYVMTRDIARTLPPEAFTVTVRGLHGRGATVTAYDPMNDRAVPVVVAARGPNTLALRLTATDYPYLLIVQER